MSRTPIAALAAALALLAAGCGGGSSRPPSPLLHPSSLHERAPAVFGVSFRTTKGTFVATFRRSWAPRGADRVYELVRAGFYDGCVFFRVVPGFVVQFGINPDPAVSKAWAGATIPDDPVRRDNAPGTITFASAGSGTRTTQLFVNLADNRGLDGQGFAPVGRVTRGLRVVESLYGGYGEAPSQLQPQMQAQGTGFLRTRFPKLDRIVTARVVPGQAAARSSRSASQSWSSRSRSGAASVCPMRRSCTASSSSTISRVNVSSQA